MGVLLSDSPPKGAVPEATTIMGGYHSCPDCGNRMESWTTEGCFKCSGKCFKCIVCHAVYEATLEIEPKQCNYYQKYKGG